MNVPIKMYDKQLRPFRLPLKMFADLITKPWGIRFVNRLMKFEKGKNIKGLHCEEHYIPSKNNGPDIRVRVFRPKNADKNLPGLLYNHGGGYMLGVPENFLGVIERYIKTRPCVVVAPDYRRSVDAPYPAAFDDCYDTLLWMKENPDLLGIDNSKIMVAGHSAGGGLTAAVTLKARDTKDVKIAFQMPIYPMIDHHQNTESAKEMDSVPAWNSKTNAMGWSLYHKDLKEIPPYAAPVLNSDYADFPPTITFVGELEPFKDETIAYVEALKAANIPHKFELFTGAFHGFDIVAKNTRIGRRANEFQFGAYAEYYDKYL